MPTRGLNFMPFLSRSRLVMLLAALPLSQAACSQHPLAKRRLAMREQQLGTTVHHLLHQESLRPARLENTLELAQESIDRSEARIARWPDRIDRWIADDVQDMSDLDSPQARKIAKHLLGGKPENIEPAFIMMFY